MTSGSSKGHSPLCTPDVNSENQCLVSVSETEKEVDVSKVDDEEGEIDVDAFDESMKRLEFIESSFKTIISEEADSVPAIQHIQDQNQVEDRLERIHSLKMPSAKVAAKKKADEKAKAKLGVKKTVKTKKVSKKVEKKKVKTIAKKEKTKKPSGAKPNSAPKKKVTKGGKKK